MLVFTAVGQTEELVSRGEGIVDQRLRDAVARYKKEPGFTAGVAKVGDKAVRGRGRWRNGTSQERGSCGPSLPGMPTKRSILRGDPVKVRVCGFRRLNCPSGNARQRPCAVVGRRECQRHAGSCACPARRRKRSATRLAPQVVKTARRLMWGRPGRIAFPRASGIRNATSGRKHPVKPAFEDGGQARTTMSDRQRSAYRTNEGLRHVVRPGRCCRTGFIALVFLGRQDRIKVLSIKVDQPDLGPKRI